MPGLRSIGSTIASYVVLTFAFVSVAHILGVISIILSFVVLPIILVIDIVSLICNPLHHEARRAFTKANYYWGTDRIIEAVKRDTSSRIREIRTRRSAHSNRSVRPGTPTMAKHAISRGSGIDLSSSTPGLLSAMISTCHSTDRGGSQSLSPLLAELPQELQQQIFIFLLHSTSRKGTYDVTPLLLCSSIRDFLLPHMYSNIHLSTPFAFRKLRETLALHNSCLGSLVRRLTLASCSFDDTGYLADPLAPISALSTGIEQLLLDAPHIQTLALDLYSLAALFEGDAIHRLETGPRPKTLKIELTFAQYLNVPMYEEVESLEVVCFGMDESVARDLREALPRLRRLTIRLVRRLGREQSIGAGVGAEEAEGTEDQDSNDRQQDIRQLPRRRRLSLWSDTPTGKEDATEMTRALKLLRTWPGLERRKGTRLEHITVLTWSSALRELQNRFKYSPPSPLEQGEGNGQRLPVRLETNVVRSAQELNTLLQVEKYDLWAQQRLRDEGTASMSAEMSSVEAPLGIESADDTFPCNVLPPAAPLRLDLDPYRSLGPRKGSILAWTR